MSSKKHSQSSRYLDHLQNTSPAKITFSFSRSSRFIEPFSESPSKFYDKPRASSRRATSLGYGRKYDFVNKALMDPGLYDTKSQFDLMKSKVKSSSQSTFGESHQNLFNRRLNMIKTPAPSYYHPEQPKKSQFHMGSRLKHIKNSAQALQIGPPTYKIQKCFQMASKYKAIRSFRIKTQTAITKLIAQSKKSDYMRGPGRYNPEKLLSLQQLANKKSIKGAASFGKQIRLKTQNLTKVGPGSYDSFSVFGKREDQE